MSPAALYRPLRRYSYLILSAGLLAGALVWAWRELSGVGALLLVGGLALGLGGVQRLLRPGRQEVKTAAAVLDAIGRGRPTLVNFYSNL